MRALVTLLLFAPPAFAESLVALRTIPARSIIAETDMALVDAEIAGAAVDPLLIAGQEARVTIFAGRPIRPADFVAPALVDRNQIVSLSYDKGALRIVTEGRALGRAGAGETVSVMNLASRATVTGTVTGPGAVTLLPPNP
jgi:flagellar basal body P-ring formation protein FlgA